jgi:hypothetical protein
MDQLEKAGVNQGDVPATNPRPSLGPAQFSVVPFIGASEIQMVRLNLPCVCLQLIGVHLASNCDLFLAESSGACQASRLRRPVQGLDQRSSRKVKLSRAPLL